MIILGLVEGHCCSASLMRDGEVIAVCFEERLSRLKNDMGLPRRAIMSCLEQAGILPHEVDHVAMVTHNLPFGQVAIKREAVFSVADHIKEQEEYWRPRLIYGEDPDFFEIFKDKARPFETGYDIPPGTTIDRDWFDGFAKVRRQTIKDMLQIEDDDIHIVHHHLAHSMYALYSTDRVYEKDWLVLVSDGYGDDCSASVATFSAKGRKFKFVAKSIGSGIGRIYRYATLVLGMRPGVDEYKMMGLAPYAKPYHSEPVRKAMQVYLRNNGMDIDYTNPDKDIYFSMKERLKADRFDGIAGGVQTFCEDISKTWVENCIRETGIPNVVYSGGVSMNIKINKVLSEIPELKDLAVGPSGGDESLSLGAAYALWHQLMPDVPVVPLKHAYLGPSYTKEIALKAIEELVTDSSIRVFETNDNSEVARRLAEGRIIARSVGSMEYGARALGNRSIMARADSTDVIQRINDKVKRRDFWMPFAPMIMAEHQSDYVVNPKAIIAPYMTIGFDSTDLAKQHLAAALHPADKSLRPQMVLAEQNPQLHDLLKQFREMTGLGGCLNTSFNLHGEPIVCTPSDAIRTFLNSELDSLVLDGFILDRS